jgi:hypothetical protein
MAFLKFLGGGVGGAAFIMYMAAPDSPQMQQGWFLGVLFGIGLTILAAPKDP